MTRLVYRPLHEWPDDKTGDHMRDSTARFKSTALYRTEALLRREAEALDASDVIIEVDLPSSAFYNDSSGVKSNARQPDFPGVVVRLVGSRFGDLRYSCDQFTNRWSGEMPGWEANLRAIALGLEALRKVERYGIARRGEQYVGWGELPPGTPMSSGQREAPQMTLDEAARFLAAAVEGLTAQDVLDEYGDARTAYRLASKRLHPDNLHTGSHEGFLRLEAAWRLVETHHHADH